MKRIAILLIVVLMTMISFVGCTSDNGVSVITSIDEEKDFSVANVKFVLEKAGGIKKILANKEDTVLVALGSGVMVTGQLIRIDTLTISSTSIQYRLKKKENYWIQVIRENEEFNLNTGRLEFTVPDADSFDINIDAKAGVTKLNLSFSIESSDICTLIVTRKIVPAGGASPRSIKDTIDVSGLSSYVFSSYLGVNYAWDVSVEAKSCSSEAYADGTVRTPVLESGKDYDGLSLDLQWHDGTKATAKILVDLDIPEEISITVSVPAQPVI